MNIIEWAALAAIAGLVAGVVLTLWAYRRQGVTLAKFHWADEGAVQGTTRPGRCGNAEWGARASPDGDDPEAIPVADHAYRHRSPGSPGRLFSLVILSS